MTLKLYFPANTWGATKSLLLTRRRPPLLVDLEPWDGRVHQWSQESL